MTKEPRLQKLKQTVLYFANHYTWAFVIVMAITVISCAFSISYLANLEVNLKEVYENDVKGGDAVQAGYTALLSLESSARDLVLFPDRKTRDRTRNLMRDQTAALRAATARAVPRFHTPKAKLAMKAAQDDQTAFLDDLDALLETSSKKPLLPADLAGADTSATVLEKDFDLLLANRSANSNIGIAELVFQLRVSLVFTIVILVVTVVIRYALYLGGHPRRQNRGS